MRKARLAPKSLPAGGGPLLIAVVVIAASPQQIEASKLLYLGAAFAMAWIGIAAYLFSLFRRQRRLEERLNKVQAQANGEQAKLAADYKTDR